MKTLIRTYDNDIYIIEGKSPTEILDSIQSMDFVQMPNGSLVNKKSISSFQTYADYQFQVEQKNRHKKGQYLAKGDWYDEKGYVATADLFKITAEQVTLPGATVERISKPYSDD